MSAGLPPIPSSAIPAGVREQGSAAVEKYEAALSFEGVLDQQLTQALASSLQGAADAGSSDDGSDGSGSSDPSTSMTLQMLPQTLAQSLVAHGGLGLAPQLYTAMGGKLAAPASTGDENGSAS